MGNPNTGEIYEGELRDEGDVTLLKEQFEKPMPMSLKDRMTELKNIMAQAAETEQTRQGDQVQNDGTVREMPRYRCHKEVWALKINDVQQAPANQEALHAGGDWVVTPEDDGYAPFPVGYDWYVRHNPQAGGYYVVYKDGYQSYSPALAFEEGYTRL